MGHACRSAYARSLVLSESESTRMPAGSIPMSAFVTGFLLRFSEAREGTKFGGLFWSSTVLWTQDTLGHGRYRKRILFFAVSILKRSSYGTTMRAVCLGAATGCYAVYIPVRTCRCRYFTTDRHGIPFDNATAASRPSRAESLKKELLRTAVIENRRSGKVGHGSTTKVLV